MSASHSLNSLLSQSALPHGAVPFDRIDAKAYGAAIDEALTATRAELKAIRENPAPVDFANTLEALEASDERLDRVTSVFMNLLHAETSDTLQALAKDVMPKLAALSNDVHLDEGLFKRVSRLHEDRARYQGEQLRLLEKSYKGFVRNGARLDAAGKAKLREIDGRLAVLSQEFSDNVLKATNAWELHLTREDELAGLPPSVIEGAAQAAKEKGKGEGWLFTLQQPSMVPFLQFSERRELREKLWRAFASRASSGKHDNRPLVRDLARLRQERAKLLGFSSHAHFVLEESMAATPDTVRKFMERLLAASRPAAEKDRKELQELAGHELQPWDMGYYSEKLRLKKYALDEEKLREYFELSNVVSGVFEHARRLYGLKFTRKPELPAYHPDVQVYEVSEETGGKFVGLFYADFHPRASKQGGAWMTNFLGQGMWNGKVERPHVSIVCNLSKPTPSQPSLLTLQEVRTVFHEFGHALHSLLSECRYRSLAGTSVYRDFVELPSQVMENWIREKESLALFARHYKTGELIPDELVQKVAASTNFQAGWMSLRQLNFATLDLAWHTEDVLQAGEDVEAYEEKATRGTRLFAHVPGTSTSCSFSHIFAGGYSAGYYSYKWAEVLDADAFELFKEKGIFNRQVADRFRTNVLSKGGSAHPMELYRSFRGREPDPDALLRRQGLL